MAPRNNFKAKDELKMSQAKGKEKAQMKARREEEEDDCYINEYGIIDDGYDDDNDDDGSYAVRATAELFAVLLTDSDTDDEDK